MEIIPIPSPQQAFNEIIWNNQKQAQVAYRLIGDWGIGDSVIWIWSVTWHTHDMPPCHAPRNCARAWAFERTRFPQRHQDEPCGRGLWQWLVSCPGNLADIWQPGRPWFITVTNCNWPTFRSHPWPMPMFAVCVFLLVLAIAAAIAAGQD